VVSNTLGPSGLALSDEVLTDLNSRDYSQTAWFEAAKAAQATPSKSYPASRSIDDLLPPRNTAPGKHPENYHLAFSAPVFSAEEEGSPSRFVGALYALVNWSRIQDEVESPVIKNYFQGLVGPDEFPSAYGWIWDRDGDTILAHDNPELYDEKVSGAVINLPRMVEDVRASDWGRYRPYTFRGKDKSAAFKHTQEGWVVGVGIDDDDIFKGVRELRELLLQATLIVLGISVLLMLITARRATAPILALREHVHRVARGDLDARVDVRTRDELGELGSALNDMTAEIAASREKLVKAEKEAAWREMARQVAHDIKNPLTPIQISIDLAERAHAEKSPEFDAIFDRTVEIISRQVAHLREIASDFHALTGARPASLAAVDVGKVLDEVLVLEAAWAQQLGVTIERRGTNGSVRAEASLLRRVLLNLVSNALQAMPQGGVLTCAIEPRGEQLEIAIRDTGAGIPDDVRRHLFEPYFTTRSTGTGLGLAIAKRVVEDFGGTIELVPAEPGPGTLARVCLPRIASA
jgi:signal transduction histidine kinase